MALIAYITLIDLHFHTGTHLYTWFGKGTYSYEDFLPKKIKSDKAEVIPIRDPPNQEHSSYH